MLKSLASNILTLSNNRSRWFYNRDRKI